MNRELRVHVPGPLGGFQLTVPVTDMFHAQAAFDHLAGKGVRVDLVTFTEHVESGGVTQPATYAEHNQACPRALAAGMGPCPACGWELPSSREIPIRRAADPPRLLP